MNGHWVGFWASARGGWVVVRVSNADAAFGAVLALDGRWTDRACCTTAPTSLDAFKASIIGQIVEVVTKPSVLEGPQWIESQCGEGV